MDSAADSIDGDKAGHRHPLPIAGAHRAQESAAQLRAASPVPAMATKPEPAQPRAPRASALLLEPAPVIFDRPSRRLPAGEVESGGGGWPYSHRLGLLIVLALQAALALRLLWSNTAFEDEAHYLWYGHLEWQHWLHGTPLPPDSFSGAPVVYPPVGALADSVGGLAGARLLSLLFMLGATALLYATATRIFGKGAGLIAAAMFVAVGPTADMSAWATFDPMAIFLVALSTWLAVRAGRGRLTELWIVLAAAVMVLADASKWVTGLWNPVIVAMVVLTAPTNWALALARGVRLVSYAFAIAAPALFVIGGAPYLVQIRASTTERDAGGTAQLSVLWMAAPMVAAVLALALLGVLLSWREHRDRRTLLCAVLAVAVVLAPTFQALDQTTVSLYKHVVFGAWFGAMGAGYALSKASVINATQGWRVGVAAAVFTGLVGFDQASFWYGLWPNSKPLMAAVEHLLPAKGPMLMQNGDGVVAYYYLLSRGLHPDIMTSYSYSADEISGMIVTHRLWMVETDTGTGTPLGSMQLSVAGSPADMERAGYRRVSRIRWRDPDRAVGWFTIWVLEPKRAAG